MQRLGTPAIVALVGAALDVLLVAGVRPEADVALAHGPETNITVAPGHTEPRPPATIDANVDCSCDDHTDSFGPSRSRPDACCKKGLICAPRPHYPNWRRCKVALHHPCKSDVDCAQAGDYDWSTYDRNFYHASDSVYDASNSGEVTCNAPLSGGDSTCCISSVSFLSNGLEAIKHRPIMKFETSEKDRLKYAADIGDSCCSKIVHTMVTQNLVKRGLRKADVLGINPFLSGDATRGVWGLSAGSSYGYPEGRAEWAAYHAERDPLCYATYSA